MEVMANSKLSLVAQFDDLCRLRNAVYGEQCIDERMIAFLRNQEKCRLLWLRDRNEAIAKEEELKHLRKENKCLETTLKNVRYALRKEIQEKEALKKEINFYRKNIKMASNFLMEYKADSNETREKVLSCLNIHHLEPVMEQVDSSDQSISDLDYDKTDDDIVGVTAVSNVTKRKSVEMKEQNILSKRTRNEIEEMLAVEEAKEVIAETPTLKHQPHSIAADVTVHRTPAVSEIDVAFKSTPHFGNVQSTPIIRKPPQSSENLTPSEMSRVHYNSRIENRMHSFVTKKIFRPYEKCGPCGGNIGFCSSCYRCQDCRAICHLECKSKVPLPCIPYVSKNEIGRRGKLTLISDYAPLNSRPCIPALIIHCVSEIEKRGLEEIGLYRTPGSQKEVNDLKERILNSKNGMPVLTNVEIPVLCGVVKAFLRSLDEPLVTRILWRDFVKAVDIESEEDKKSFLYQAISELPIANRDTLAYLIVHLQRIADSPACRMPKSNLAKVFGPTIVGHSMMNPPPMTMLTENPIQVKVMEALLNIPTEYWNNFISQYTAPASQQQPTRSTSRSSTTPRVHGASISSGILTPLRQKVIKSTNPKPLF
ncbi:rac GTPase-activating protein 1-like protein [Dinothrombium tinctorium]|uniref:Rac GTPase-activating protein 1-like protein n=1 Tax=Dinothrombium tinctorium TaxID=1965070 RepID=A0A3S3PTX8_9ACAR|nr:rac GTPase-activating protein 1-like protein [Dinothrombium tinctorium]